MASLDDRLRSLVYARNDDDARALYSSTRFVDPLSDVPLGLLNREEIARYVAASGMIHPFDWQKLKPASYEAQVGTEVLYWDDDGKQIHRTALASSQAIKFRHNSITYIGLNIKFRLPLYIAVRFNLTITHVHRGLLLGTGPLVDPTYEGPLMIPIHNLTPNDYVVRPGDDLVAIEFTKIGTPSPDAALTEELVRNVKERDKSFPEFLTRALPGDITSVRSSLGAAVQDAEAATRRLQTYTNIGSIAAVFAISGVVISMLVLVMNVQKYVTDSREEFRSELRRVEKMIPKVETGTTQEPMKNRPSVQSQPSPKATPTQR